ncbi:MAG: glycoside hydrolase family 9 protein [Lachnospiraceae bacterium]|nr:glycoside hydrolase family 9 protein [Lachnospiraceae bacterium]
MFYELQRSGDLPEQVRCNWRGDSCLTDGADNGIDLTGGWFDAGDHVKFNLPMAYTGAMLAWSLYEDRDAYEESGQLEYMLGDLKWVNDYLIKCSPSEDIYYYQVGSGSGDHTWWGPAEVIHMDRPSYAVTKSSPGSCVCAGSAACLAAASVVFRDVDGAYADECLKHAKMTYKLADETRSDSGYTEANGFYTSNSGFYDELSWAGVWLYKATGEKEYLTKAEADYGAKEWDYNWAHCWDDVHVGAALLLERETGDGRYKKDLEKHLDYWSCGTDGERITYSPKGLAWLDGWGPLRYATTTAFIAAVYSESGSCDADKKDIYWDFARSQADYALGSSGRSYVCGFGDNPPEHPHHRTAQGSYCDNMNEPSSHRHTLYGALVGGPDANDSYTDEVSNYQTNEVACDYNAGFTGLLAKMYTRYHGKTIKDFGAVEQPDSAEFYTEAGVNVSGQDFIEIRAFVYNTSAWPARTAQDLEFRYFVDLSEVYDAGGTVGNIEITTNYMSGGRVDGLRIWDEEKHLYYLSAVFDDDSLYPGGQNSYKKEMQIRMRNPLGVWDDSNDPSYAGLNTSNGQTGIAESIALYENGRIVFGREPEGGENAGALAVEAPGAGNGSNGSGQGTAANAASQASSSNGELSVSVKYDGGQAISGTMEIKNTGGDIDLGSLKILYYFTAEGGSMTYDCYHSAVNGANGSYNGLSGVTGSFSAASGEGADSVCTMSFPAGSVGQGDTLTVNFCIHKSDWSVMNCSDDWSYKDPGNIVIESGGNVIFGSRPN